MLAGGLRAQTVTINKIEYTVNDDGLSASVTDADENITTADIPATVTIDGADYPVTAIGNEAFYRCLALQSVTLPEGLQSIGGRAFRDCVALTGLILPEGLQDIGDMAFHNCESLQSIVLPGGVRDIVESTFRNCTSLANVTLPEGLQSIGDAAFYYCPALESITLPEGLQTIDNRAFSYCLALESITLPEGLQSIGNEAFAYCTSLASITSHALTPPAIREDAFDSATYATATLTVPQGTEAAYRAAEYWGWFYNTDQDGITYVLHDGGQSSMAIYADKSITAADIPATVTIDGAACPVTAIGNEAFYDCTALASIDLPEGLQTIGNYAFSGCWALANVALPEGLQSIGKGAFSQCETLASVTLPSTLQSIGHSAFFRCPLADVTSLAATPPAIHEDTFNAYNYEEAVLHVPANVLRDYQAAEYWEQFLNVDGDLPPVGIGSVAADASLATYANGTLTLSDTGDITVYAQSGARVLHATDATSLSLEGLPRGIYIISIAQGRQQQVMKVIR